MSKLVDQVIHSSNLFQLADNLDIFIEYTAKLGANSSKLLSELYSSLKREIGPDLVQVHGFYRILSGPQGICAYLNTYWNYVLSCDHNLMALLGICMRIREEFIEPCGSQISQRQIEFIVTSLEDKIHLFSKLYAQGEYLDIILLDHTYKGFNSKINLLDHPDGNLQERIFMSYTVPEMVKSVETIFLHELGHAIHHRITKSVKTIPESFKALLSSLYDSAKFIQFLDAVYDYESYDEQVTELFADCFALVIAKFYIPSLANEYVNQMVNILMHHIQPDSALFLGTLKNISHLSKLDVPDKVVLLSILGSYFLSEIDLAAGTVGVSYE